MNFKKIILLISYFSLSTYCYSQIKVKHIVIRPSLSFGVGLLNTAKFNSDYLPNKSILNYNYSIADVIENPMAAIDIEFFKLNNFIFLFSYGTSKAQFKAKTQWGNALIDGGSSSILLTNYGIGIRKNFNFTKRKSYLSLETKINLASNHRTNYSIENIFATKTTSGILYDSLYAKNNSLTKTVLLSESTLTYHFVNKKNRENCFFGIGLNLGFKPIYEGYNYRKTDYFNYYLETRTSTNGSLIKFKLGFPIDILKLLKKNQ
jgi:hypothetical protein